MFQCILCRVRPSGTLITCSFVVLLAGLFSSLSACITVTDQILPSTVHRQNEAVTVAGPPQAEMMPHPDLLGWTVRVVQPLSRHTKLVWSQREQRHHYYLNPLVLPAGLFACPASAWGWAWTSVFAVLAPPSQLQSQQNLRDFTWTSCLMAFMIARSEPRWVKAETITENRVEPDFRPMAGATAILTWQGPHAVRISYPVESDGRAIIRLAHLATAIRHEGFQLSAGEHMTVEFAIWYQDKLIRQWPLPVSAETLQAATRLDIPIVAPQDRWPRPLIFKVMTESLPQGLTPFMRLLLQHGITVVAPDSQRATLQHELQRNLQPMVEDQPALGPGHWHPATILLLVDMHRDSGSSVLAVSCLSIRTGDVLARMEIAAGPDGIQMALDVAIIRFRDVLHLLTDRSRPPAK